MINGYLIAPPAMFPEQPVISIAVLKTYLMQKKIGLFKCADLNKEFFYYLIDKISKKDTGYDSITELGIKVAALDYINNTMKFDIESLEYKRIKNQNETSHWAPPFPFSYYELVPYIEKDPQIVDSFLNSEKNIYVKFFEQLLEERKIKIDYIDFYGLSIIGFFQVIPALTIAKCIKQRNPNAKICFGGPWITLYAEKLTDLFSKNVLTDYIDFFSIAEGEYSIEKILEYMKGNVEINEIPNAIVKIDDVFVDTELFEIFNMSDSTLPPDYSDFELEKYFSFIEGEGRISVQSSRGCYHNKCSFCNALTNLRCKTLRQKDIELFIDELRKLKEQFPSVRVIDFADCVSSKKRLLSLAEFFKENDLKWEIDIRLEKWIDDELISAVKNSNGLLRFGLEAVSQRLLDLHNKGNKMTIVIEIMERCKQFSYKPFIMTIVGLPSETIQEAYELESFLLKYIDNCIPLVEDFNLERNTDIYYNPEKYNIEILPETSFLDPYISFIRKEGYSSAEEKKIYESVFINIMKASFDLALVQKEDFQWEFFNLLFDIPEINVSQIQGIYNGIPFTELNPHFKQALYAKGIFVKNMSAVMFTAD